MMVRNINAFVSLALILLLTVLTAGCGLEKTSDLTTHDSIFLNGDLNIVSPPDVYSERWGELNRSSGYVVVKSENKLFITEQTDFYALLPLSLEDVSGWFVGINYGEFGGGLYFITSEGMMTELDDFMSSDGIKDSIPEGMFYNISHYPPVALYELNDGYYFLWNSGHMVKDPQGGIFQLLQKDGTWYSKEYLSLPEGPEVCLIDGQDLYIVTNTNLLAVRGGKIEILLDDLFWKALYPNSIVKLDDCLYIGMRGGVASYNLETSELVWYEKSD